MVWPRSTAEPRRAPKCITCRPREALPRFWLPERAFRCASAHQAFSRARQITQHHLTMAMSSGKHTTHIKREKKKKKKNSPSYRRAERAISGRHHGEQHRLIILRTMPFRSSCAIVPSPTLRCERSEPRRGAGRACLACYIGAMSKAALSLFSAAVSALMGGQ